MATINSAFTGRSLIILAFVVVLGLAAGVRLLTFERWLPFTDYNDENNMYLLGRDWLGVEHDPIVPQWLAGYPPLYVWINMGVQKLVEAFPARPWILPADYLHALRLVAVLVGVATTGVIAVIGWQLGGTLAAWLAGLIWGLSPVIVEHNSLAIPDPWVYLACAVAIALALAAWQRQSPAWSVGSLIAGIIAVYLKYPAAYALIPWGLVTLALCWRLRWRMLPWLVLQALIAGAAAGYLIFGYGALGLSNREADSVRAEGLRWALDLDRNLNNWQFAVFPLGVPLFAVVIIGQLIAYRITRRPVDWQVLVILWVYCLIGMMVSAMFSRVNLPAGKIRHVLPMTVALIPVWAAGVAYITNALRPTRGWWLVTAAVLVIFVPVAFAGNAELVRRFREPDIHEMLWRWSDENIPNDGLILMSPDSVIERTWNRNYSGYDGVKPFEWWFETEPWQDTPAQLADRRIRYFAMTARDGYNREAIENFTEQLVLVKSFPAGSDRTKPAISFYQTVPPQHETTAEFGDQIALIGYDLSANELTPGAAFTFRPYWRALQPPDNNYSMFIHLYPGDTDELLAQYDGAPTNPQRLTLTWTDLHELYIGSDVSLIIPADTPAGRYRLVIGLYDFASGQRLLLPTGESYYALDVQVR